MAAGGAEVLQEYLVKLGFVTDKLGLKKMDDTLSSVGKKVLGVGTAVGQMVVAAEVAVGLFANQMEKLYYASKLSGSSAANFKSLSSAQEAVGLSSGTIERVTKNINLAMNSGNPAMQTYINNVLGVKTAGRDMTAVLLSSAQAIKKISEQQGDIPAKAAAARLGFSDEDYFQLIKTEGALEKLIATDTKRKAALTASGIDYKAATQAGLEYSNMLSEMSFKLGILWDVIGVKLLPMFKSLNAFLASSAQGAINLFGNTSWHQLGQNIKSHFTDNADLSYDKRNETKATQQKANNNSFIYGGSNGAKITAQRNPLVDKLFNKGEGDYNSYNSGTKGVAGGKVGHSGKANLQEMTLNEILKSASTRDGNDKRRIFAAGRYQIISPTLKETIKRMGLSGNEKFTNDLQDKMFESILSQNPKIAGFLNGKHNSVENAQAGMAEVWASFINPKTGKGNYDKAGTNRATITPAESEQMLLSMRNTRLASGNAGGASSIVQTNTFNISGTDGHALSKAVIVAQSRTNADAVRALGSKVS